MNHPTSPVPGSPSTGPRRWGGRRLPWLLLISAAVIFLDRLTKTLVAARIPLGGGITVIPHVLRITHWTNEGAAFSLFADSASPNAVRWGLIAFSLIAALAVLVAMIRLGDRISITTVALALIFAGALGNVHDRIVYGSVVDFIEVHIFSYHWPDFNVADSSIVIGACLLLLDSLLPRKHPSI
ncbi:MAG TPA: signal peptidase II [Terracidiphilus sp.]|nr:signal peptidase II [Terracidiphilus sp.]